MSTLRLVQVQQPDDFPDPVIVIIFVGGVGDLSSESRLRTKAEDIRQRKTKHWMNTVWKLLVY